MWALIQLHDTHWEWGAGGYRIHYKSGGVIRLAVKLGYREIELLDLTRRIKVYETTMLDIEARRFKFDDEKREAEARSRESAATRAALMRR